MLQNFYTLHNITCTGENNYSTVIGINPRNEVFNGHFPGNPVVPGVCIMHIVKDIAQQVTGSSLTLKTAVNVKFLSLINPEATPELDAELEITGTPDEYIKVKSTIGFNHTTAVKLSCVYYKN